jgi:hypothetical protein
MCRAYYVRRKRLSVNRNTSYSGSRAVRMSYKTYRLAFGCPSITGISPEFFCICGELVGWPKCFGKSFDQLEFGM